ncbi:MAG: hypothetical protein ACRDGS_11575 [Chloroflexota bacterium]
MTIARAERVPTREVDLAVFSANGQLQLVAEVKNRVGATLDWAARMRLNLVEYSDMPDAPFFLLALPDHFYLWHEVTPRTTLAYPQYDINPTSILAPYLGVPSRSVDTMSESGLLLAVSAWLSDLVASSLDRREEKPDCMWLFDSMLYDTIKGGTVRTYATL